MFIRIGNGPRWVARPERSAGRGERRYPTVSRTCADGGTTCSATPFAALWACHPDGPRRLGARPGVTLTEVLVAIFIMGVGLLSLLVLFPLGGLKMALAIKDERTAHASADAQAIACLWCIPNDPQVFASYTQPTSVSHAAITSGRSYSVYIDPLGVQLGASRLGGASGMDRVAPAYPDSASVRRWFTLLDDLQFDEDGIPKVSGGILQRDTRYSWALLCTQVRATPPTGTPPFSAPDGVELTVVVYDRRPELTSTDGGDSLPNETILTAAFTANSTSVVVNYTGAKPDVSRGNWILDATMTPTRNGYFYRVASVEDGPGANQLTLVLTQPARASGTVCVIMQNVAEVFEKGVVKLNGYVPPPPPPNS